MSLALFIARDLIARALLDRGQRAAPAALHRPALIDPGEGLAIYVHLPFCASRCRYCSFATTTDRRLMEQYVSALELEIAKRAALPWKHGVPVTSLFIGGGTPSLVPAELVTRVLEAVGARFFMQRGLQITIEANPESIRPRKLAAYRAAGISRISLGVQSFDEASLARLGRMHRQRDIHRALDDIAAAGFRDASVDLMYGVPGQSLDGFVRDLQLAFAAPVTHLSIFPMIFLPGTALFARRTGGELRRLHELRKMYAVALDELPANGFLQYTTEDFGRNGGRCEYQVDAWQPWGRGCLGLGAGALSSAGGYHWRNPSSLPAYFQTVDSQIAGAVEGVQLDRSQEIAEHVYKAVKCLRLDRRQLEERFGASLERLLGPLPWLLRALGLARELHSDGSLELTRRGRFFASLYWSRMILKKLAQVASPELPSAAGCAKAA